MQPNGSALGGTVWVAEDGSEACAYLSPASPGPVVPGMSLVRIEQTLALDGEAQGRECSLALRRGYGCSAAQEVDFNAWYDTEHLAGLAAVPGVARATRYRVVRRAPGRGTTRAMTWRSEALQQSRRGMAVRGTPWSSRVRPGFFNTRRTMYRRLD
jgi:hypothetical protein